MKNIFALFVLIFLVTPLRLQGQEWTRFRGPNGSGLAEAPGLPVKWSEKDFLWKIELPGGGHSSPVVWGDKVFVTSADKETGARTLLCIGVGDGHVLWKREFPLAAYGQHNDNSYAAATPAVDADHVYICWITPEHYDLIAIDHAGKDVWKVDLGPFKTQHMNGSSPILFEDMVIIANDQDIPASCVIALDRKTGARRWRVPRQSTKAASATPCIYQPKGQPAQLILTSFSDGMTALDPYTGSLLWRLNDVFDVRVVASPIVAGDLLIGNAGEGPGGRELVAVKPAASREGKAQVAYKLVPKTPYVPTPLAKGNRLFMWADSGIISCLEASTGREIWSEKVGASFYGSPVCVNDKLYCVSKKGEVFVVSAGDKYQMLARNPLGELAHTTPAISGGRMFVRTYSHLVCIGAKP